MVEQRQIEGFNDIQSAEFEYWNANKGVLSTQYPAHYVIIRNKNVTGHYSSFEALAAAEQNEEDENYLVGRTEGMPLPVAVTPYSVITGASVA